jgi:hypothetical protein
MVYPESSRQARLQLDAADRAVDRDDAESAIAHAGFLVTYAEAMVEAAVEHARANLYSWQRIGDMLGITKQGAQQRFGQLDSAEAPD